MSIISEFNLDELKEIVKNASSYSAVAKAVGYKTHSSFNVIKKYLEEQNISTAHFTHLTQGYEVRNIDNIFITNSTVDQKTLRSWYLKGNYTPYICSVCGQEPWWNGKELSLTLDHINEQNHDNRLENLRWVCPNCDRQLDTFGSKNIIYQKQMVSKEQHFCECCGTELKTKTATLCPSCVKIQLRKTERPETAEKLTEILQENGGNFSAVGRLYGVSDNAIRKWCKSYNISTKSIDYK